MGARLSNHQLALERLAAVARAGGMEPEHGNKLTELLNDPDALLAIDQPSGWGHRYEALMVGFSRDTRGSISRASKDSGKAHREHAKKVEAEEKAKKKVPHVELHPQDAVIQKMETAGENGERIPSSVRNVLAVLRYDTRWAGRLRRNSFTYENELDGQPMTDEVETQFIEWASLNYAVNFTSEHVLKSMSLIAAETRHNPVLDHLNSLVWDGVERMDHWLVAFCGCDPQDGLTAKYARRFLLSAVARQFEPGCKVDTALILHGGQGALKSTVLEALAYGKWFSDSHIKIESKEGYQSIMGVWIYEFGELDSLKRREAEAVKSFLSSRKDKFRPPYAHHDILALRQVVFCGTTNEDEFLVDPTGNRRFWVVTVGDIDIEGLKLALDQIWAEAVHEYRAAEDCPACALAGRCPEHRWWFDRDEEAVRAPANDRYQVTHQWQHLIEVWCHEHADNRKAGVHTHEVLKEAVGIDKGDITKLMEMSLHTMMVSCGWTKPAGAIRVDGRRARGYYPPTK